MVVTHGLLSPWVQGHSQDFSSGAHTVSNNIVMAFSPRNIVGCLLKNRLTKGRSQAPQDPPPKNTLGVGTHEPSCHYHLRLSAHSVALHTMFTVSSFCHHGHIP